MKFTTCFVFFAFRNCAFAALFLLLLQTRVVVCGRFALEIVDIAFLFETQLTILIGRARQDRKNSVNSKTYFMLVFTNL